MQLTEEQQKKVNAAKTAEELIALAKAEGIQASEEEIRTFFEARHKEGALADEELDNVAGGTCYSSGIWGPNGYQKYAIVTVANYCGWYTVENGADWPDPVNQRCVNCAHSFTIGATLYCDKRTEGNDPVN